jgi:hypothetical protein
MGNDARGLAGPDQSATASREMEIRGAYGLLHVPTNAARQFGHVRLLWRG